MSSIIKLIEITPWFQQIAALLTIIGIPYAFLKLVIYKARHKIFFNPKDTYHKRILVDYPDKPWSLWLHLMVKNNGFEISKNVEAYLTEIWVQNQESIKNYDKLKDFMAPVKLKWAHEKFISPIEILPRQERRLDVCFSHEGEKILTIMTSSFPGGTIKNRLDPSNYVFVVSVVSQNSLKPAKFLFNVVWDGAWEALRGENYIANFRPFGRPVKSFVIY